MESFGIFIQEQCDCLYWLHVVKALSLMTFETELQDIVPINLQCVCIELPTN